MTQLRRLLAVLLVATGLAAVPASAAAKPSLTGTAGSYATVHLGSTWREDSGLRDIAALVPSRGDFVGFSLVDLTGDHWLTITVGYQRTAGCAWDPHCFAFNDPSLVSSDDAGAFVALPPGTYRVVLLARPGATVTLAGPLPFLKGAMHTTQRADLAVHDLVSTYPPVGSTQPKANGSTDFASTGLHLSGLVVRADLAMAHEVDYDFCIGAASSLDPAVVCNQTEASVGGGSYFFQCGPAGLPTLVCLPAGVDPFVFTTGLAAVVPRGHTVVSWSGTLRAVKSRTAAVAFTVSF